MPALPDGEPASGHQTPRHGTCEVERWSHAGLRASVVPKKDTVLLKPGPPPWGVSFLAPWRLRGISIHYPPQREARAVYSASEPGSRSLSPVPNVPSSGTQRPVSSGNSWAPLVRTNSLQVHRSQLTTATGSYMRTYRATRLLD